MFFYFLVISTVHGRMLVSCRRCCGKSSSAISRVTKVGRKTVGSRSHGGVLPECEDY